ncbi:MAG: type II toxin-antitoxin system Phd/YefM family antitoxin [Burkholderiales bacterium]
MQTSVRELKAQLSQLLRRVEAGDTVTVRAHNKPVAEIVPIRKKQSTLQLAAVPGIHWNGKKPKGIARPESLPKDVSVSDWVTRDRR